VFQGIAGRKALAQMQMSRVVETRTDGLQDVQFQEVLTIQ
jgi:hypothetical protein